MYEMIRGVQAIIWPCYISTDRAKIVQNETRNNINVYLPKKAKKKTFFNILHLNTEVNKLNIVY